VSVSTVGTLPAEALRLGLVPNHAYAVVGWNASQRRVQLRNPWNNPGMPGGAVFELRLDQLRAWFNNLATDGWVAAITP
jgi:hypothetical protein